MKTDGTNQERGCHSHTQVPDEDMAGTLSWNLEYAKGMRQIMLILDDLRKHDGFEDTEDLGDYVDMLSTLMSFRPWTRRDMENRAMALIGQVKRGDKGWGCTCGTPPFAPPEPADDCPFHYPLHFEEN